jgi:hypothetical protein
MRFRGGEFSTGTMWNFQPELTRKRNNLFNIITSLEQKHA